MSESSGGSRASTPDRSVTRVLGDPLGEAYHWISASLEQTQASIRAIERKMKRTDESVAGMAQRLRVQEQIMLRLEQRIEVLEELIPPPAHAHCHVPANTPAHANTPLKASSQRSEASGCVVGLWPPPFPVASCPSVASPESRQVQLHVGAAPSLRPAGSGSSGRNLGQERADSALGRQLLRAAEDGQAAEVQRLLSKGAAVDFRNSSRWTPLHKAAMKANPQMVSLLLANGADANAKTGHGYSPLHIAAHYDRSGRCVAQLLAAGGNVDVWNEFRRTPLHYAALAGNKAAVSALVAAGACKHVTDKQRRSPFDVAKSGNLRQLLSY